LLLASSVAGCTRSASVKDVDIDKNAADAANPQTEPETTVVTPVENVPDVDISPNAEIPSDKDVTDIKTPDVEVDTTKDMGEMEDTRVDAVDDSIDEP